MHNLQLWKLKTWHTYLYVQTHLHKAKTCVPKNLICNREGTDSLATRTHPTCQPWHCILRNWLEYKSLVCCALVFGGGIYCHDRFGKSTAGVEESGHSKRKCACCWGWLWLLQTHVNLALLTNVFIVTPVWPPGFQRELWVYGFHWPHTYMEWQIISMG
jgi:hypothetical protein